MATELSLVRLHELLQQACNSCESALEAAMQVLDTLPTSFECGEQNWTDWWKENKRAAATALGNSHQARLQLVNAAKLCEQDWPHDGEQLRKAGDELEQFASKINTLHYSVHHAAGKADCDTYGDLWCELWNKAFVAGAGARALLNSKAIKQPPVILTPSEERAKFCFEQWNAGKSYKEINAALKKHPVWEHFASAIGVRSPIMAWSKRIGKQPRKGQAGRPKGGKKQKKGPTRSS
jgi:hypothetical protein